MTPNTHAILETSHLVPLNPTGIPVALRDRQQWVLWRMVTGEDGKPRKKTFQTSGIEASSTDAATWAAFADVLARYQQGGYAGVGYVFSHCDPYTGIHFHGCRDPETGEIAQWASGPLHQLNSYAEISPSGSGFMVIVHGKSPFETGKFLKLPQFGAVGGKTAAIDLYCHSHCSCLTGNVLQQVSDAIEPRQLQWLCQHFWPSSQDALLLNIQSNTQQTGERGDLRTSQPTPLRRPSTGRRGSPVIVHEVAQYPCTDLGNARRLVALHGQDIRYCFPQDKWYVWTGQRWEPDQTGAILRMAKDTVSSILSEAARQPDEKRQKQLFSHALASQSTHRIRAMLELAQSENGVPLLPEDCDRDIWALNVANGTLRLRGPCIELVPHRREDLITSLAPVDYLPEATAPRWEQTLLEIANQQTELVRYIQRLMGYALTGCVHEQILAVFFGTGCNGKTTLLETMLALMGPDYSLKAAPDLLMTKPGARPAETADLFRKRLVVCAETEAGRRLAESIAKELSGSDTIRARRMREDFWAFTPRHKIILATNHKPDVRGTDNAIWRRLRLVPLDANFQGREDWGLLEKLRAELPGILNWALAGCLAWQNLGLGEPEEVCAATRAYRVSQDTLADFLATCCQVQEQMKVRASELFEQFRLFAGSDCPSQRRFCQMLVERGFQRKANNGIWYHGLGMRTTEATQATEGIVSIEKS